MHILALIQGFYGQRMVDNIRRRGPKDWTVEVLQLSPRLPIIVDDPEEFPPSTLPQVDMVLALHENSQAAQLIPTIAKCSGTKAVLYPIDNSAWTPTGLKNQLQRELEEMGVASAFPKTFCTLTEETAGYRRQAEPYSSPIISEFAKYFGKPKLNLTVDTDTGIIERIEVVRGAPCGATHFAAEKLVGTSVDDAVPKAGLISHQYPCLASMERELIDDRLEDTLMHLSGYVLNEEMEEKIKPYKKKPLYFAPGERVPTAKEGKS